MLPCNNQLQQRKRLEMDYPKSIKRFESLLIRYLIALLALVVFISAVDLGWLIVKDVLSEPVLLLDINELLEIFGMFLLVLIGVELLETIKAYLTERVIHVEVVFTVALIAVARKVIILDVNQLSSLTLVGIAAIIVALSAGYYLIKRTNRGASPMSPPTT